MSFAPITHALPGHLQVSLSAMHRYLGDALDGPLKEGQLGTVVGFDCSVKPCLVRSASGEGQNENFEGQKENFFCAVLTMLILPESVLHCTIYISSVFACLCTLSSM